MVGLLAKPPNLFLHREKDAIKKGANKKRGEGKYLHMDI
jgi:hypothetical protein